MIRLCRKCDTEKELNSENFHINKKNGNGFQYYCKVCVIQLGIERNKIHPNLRKKKGFCPFYKQILNPDYYNTNIKLTDRVLFSKNITFEDVPQLIQEGFRFILKD